MRPRTSCLPGQEHVSDSVVSDYDMDASGNWVLIDESSPSPEISGSSGIAFFQSGSAPTGGSVLGIAFTSGSVTSDDQGDWTAVELAEGDWSYSGSGSTTLDGAWDVSYGPENAVAGPLVQPTTFYTQQDPSLNPDASEGVLAGAIIGQGVTVSVSLVSGPSHGSLTLYSDGSFDYEPDSGWFGSDSFVVQLDDGTLTSAAMTQTIQVSQVISLANNDFRAVATGDFDDDGESDFVAANYSTAEVYLFLGNGDGSFQTPTAISVGYGAVALAVADLGNGTLDIVVANSSDGTVTILSNDGNGSFSTSQTLSVGNDPSAVVLGDFLGNGRVDLAVANQGDDTISLFANDGSGNFTLDSTVNVGTEPTALAAADLDDDGDDDLVVANSGDGTIWVLLNTGSGTFATPVSYTVGTSPKAVAVADFDDDGNLDVAVANSGSDSLSVLLGNGDGSLEDAVSYAVGTTPVSLVVWVGNTAGVPDLLVANQGSDDLTILFNNGFGVFSASESIPLGHSPDAVAVADFDNDGLADYVADDVIQTGGLQSVLASLMGGTRGRPRGDATFLNFRKRFRESVPGLKGIDSNALRGHEAHHTIPREFEERFLKAPGKMRANINEHQWIVMMDAPTHQKWTEAWDKWKTAMMKANNWDKDQFLANVKLKDVLKARNELMEAFRGMVITSGMSTDEVNAALRAGIKRRSLRVPLKALQERNIEAEQRKQRALAKLRDSFPRLKKLLTGLVVFEVVANGVAMANTIAGNNPQAQAAWDKFAPQYDAILRNTRTGIGTSTNKWADMLFALQAYLDAAGVPPTTRNLLMNAALRQLGDLNDNVFYPPGLRRPAASTTKGKQQVTWERVWVLRTYPITTFEVVDEKKYQDWRLKMDQARWKAHGGYEAMRSGKPIDWSVWREEMSKLPTTDEGRGIKTYTTTVQVWEQEWRMRLGSPR